LTTYVPTAELAAVSFSEYVEYSHVIKSLNVVGVHDIPVVTIKRWNPYILY